MLITIEKLPILTLWQAYQSGTCKTTFNLENVSLLSNLTLTSEIELLVKRIHVIGCVKLTGYFALTANVVSSNSCVGSLPRVKISFFLLSICTDELISAPKIMKFFPMPPSVNEMLECQIH